MAGGTICLCFYGVFFFPKIPNHDQLLWAINIPDFWWPQNENPYQPERAFSDCDERQKTLLERSEQMSDKVGVEHQPVSFWHVLAK